jgi:hypothetical protein
MFIYQQTCLFTNTCSLKTDEAPYIDAHALPVTIYLNHIQTAISTANCNRRNTKLDRNQPHIHCRSERSPRFSLNVCLLLGDGGRGNIKSGARYLPFIPLRATHKDTHYVTESLRLTTRNVNMPQPTDCQHTTALLFVTPLHHVLYEDTHVKKLWSLNILTLGIKRGCTPIVQHSADITGPSGPKPGLEAATKQNLTPPEIEILITRSFPQCSHYTY